MTCSRCGKEQSPRNDSRFCAFCGAELYPRPSASHDAARGPWWEELEDPAAPRAPAQLPDVDFNDAVFAQPGQSTPPHSTPPPGPTTQGPAAVLARAAPAEPLTMHEVPLASFHAVGHATAPHDHPEAPEPETPQLPPAEFEFQISPPPSVVARYAADLGPTSEAEPPATVLLPSTDAIRCPVVDEPAHQPALEAPVIPDAPVALAMPEAPSVVEAAEAPVSAPVASAPGETLAPSETHEEPAPHSTDLNIPPYAFSDPPDLPDVPLSEASTLRTSAPTSDPLIEEAPRRAPHPPEPDVSDSQPQRASLAQTWGASLQEGPMSDRAALEPLAVTTVSPISEQRPISQGALDDWGTFDENDRDRNEFQSLFRSRFGRAATGFTSDRPIEITRPSIAFERHVNATRGPGDRQEEVVPRSPTPRPVNMAPASMAATATAPVPVRVTAPSPRPPIEVEPARVPSALPALITAPPPGPVRPPIAARSPASRPAPTVERSVISAGEALSAAQPETAPRAMLPRASKSADPGDPADRPTPPFGASITAGGATRRPPSGLGTRGNRGPDISPGKPAARGEPGPTPFAPTSRAAEADWFVDSAVSPADSAAANAVIGDDDIPELPAGWRPRK